MLQSNLNDQHKIVGVDFFIESAEQPQAIADKCLLHTTTTLRLVTITNRGTQVWPSGSVFTNLINQYYCRFETVNESPLSQNDVIDFCEIVQQHYNKNYSACYKCTLQITHSEIVSKKITEGSSQTV